VLGDGDRDIADRDAVLAISAPTTLALELAEECGLRLIAQARWPWRFDGRRLQEPCRLLPNLWSSPKAAECWLEKEPLDAHRDIIRVWGLLHEYHPPGQTSWSKALVRHGADLRAALAAVLGVRVEHIPVRN